MTTEIARGSVGLQVDRGAFEKDVLGATGGAAEKAGALFSSKFSGLIGKLGSAGSNLGLPFAGALSAAGKKVDETGKKLDETGSKVSGLGGAMGKATLPALAMVAAVTAVGVEAFKLGTEMQAADASIAAHAGISTAAAKKIGDAFLDTAGKSTFSGQEMAKAFAPVAGQLGLVEGHALSAAQATRVMKAAADLAEASGGALADTTASLASVMQTYGIRVSDAAGASNVLWNAARLTGTSIDSFAQTTERLHARLGDLSPSLSDTAGLLLDLKEHGETGRTAMSAMSTAFSTLLSGTKPVDAELKALGISIFDSSGKFVGMGSVLEQLSPKLAAMTEAQRHTAEIALVGKTAAGQLNSTLLAGLPAFDAATAAVTKHGAVESAARLQSQTFEGQIKTLKATALDLGTKLGQVLIPAFERLAAITEKVVGWSEKHKAVAMALGVIMGGVALVAIVAYTAAMASAAVATVAATWPILAIGAAVAAVVAGIVALAKNWSTIWRDIKQWTLDGVKVVVDAFLGMAGWIIKGAADAFGWVPGIGGKLKDAAKHFDDFKAHVDAALGDTNAGLALATKNMDAFNAKAAATGQAVRQLPSGGYVAAGGQHMMAVGGLVTKRTPNVTLGEAGSELVLPLTNPAAAAHAWTQAQMAGFDLASVMPNGGGGGGTTYNQTIIVKNTEPRRLGLDLIRELKVQQFLLGLD